jgi:hypothetical protein
MRILTRTLSPVGDINEVGKGIQLNACRWGHVRQWAYTFFTETSLWFSSKYDTEGLYWKLSDEFNFSAYSEL